MITASLRLPPFLLTLALSALVGIGVREYYEGEHKYDTFGSVRTFILIGLLGFVLYGGALAGGAAYVASALVLGAVLTTYYVDKLRRGKGAGIIGILIGLLTFAIGPLALTQPSWVPVLVTVTVLFVLHSKGPIRRFTDRLAPGEVLTVCKFLVIAGVALPLVPRDAAAVTGWHGWAGWALSLLPITPRQLWWAVVITTGISYAGYVAQVYAWPSRGLRLTGLFGGIYSSTATVFVIARRSRQTAPVADASAGVLLAVAMMYVRLFVIVAIFRPSVLAAAAAPLLVLAALAMGSAAAFRAPRTTLAGDRPEAAAIRHPLEVTAALIFAALFAVIAAATKWALATYAVAGLHWMAVAVGFSDITPFVISLLAGDLGLSNTQIVNGIIVASASNNLLKSCYVIAVGTRALSRRVVPILVALAAISAAYAVLR